MYILVYSGVWEIYIYYCVVSIWEISYCVCRYLKIFIS